MCTLDYKDVVEAYGRIKNYIHTTPVLTQNFINNTCGTELYLKLENFQKTGSFKARGAFNKILYLDDKNRAKGVVTASSGNHGAAVAYAGNILKIPATVVVPETALKAKLKAIEGYGANIIVCGTTSEERRIKAREISEKEGKTFIHSFDDPYVIAGQGTIGYEILNQINDVEAILAPIGGGGLISGISLIKQIRPDIKVIGVEPSGSAGMNLSIKNKKITPLIKVDSIADGLRAKCPGQLTFEVAKTYVDDFVTVNDDEIFETMINLLQRCKILAEPSGVTALAYAMQGKIKGIFKKVVCVVSGGNVGVDRLIELCNQSNKLI